MTLPALVLNVLASLLLFFLSFHDGWVGVGPRSRTTADMSVIERLLRDAEKGIYFDNSDPDRTDTVAGKLQPLIRIMMLLKSGGEVVVPTSSTTTENPRNATSDGDKGDEDDDELGNPRSSLDGPIIKSNYSVLLTIILRQKCYADRLQMKMDPIQIRSFCNIRN